MSAASQTKIFGMRLGVDPKILVGGLVALAAVMFWFNSRGDDEQAGSSSGGLTHPAAVTTAAPAAETVRARVQRRRASREDRGTIRVQNIDPTRGDINPELRLDLMERLARVKAPGAMRNLFESGPAAIEGGGLHGMPVRMIATTKPVELPAMTSTPPVIPKIEANIPLKYYGFVKPVNKGDGNRGFFLDGDNIVVATEGQLVKQRYMVVQLNARSARLDDTQIKMGQTLALVPEALEQGSNGFGAGNPQIVQPQEQNEELAPEEPEPQNMSAPIHPGFPAGMRGIGVPPQQPQNPNGFQNQ